MSRSKKLKEIVKGAADERTYGTDPRDPWSTTSKISESPNLNQYLLSRGFDPKHTPKNIKVAHSKSNQFKTWQRQHFNEDLTTKHTGAGVDHKTDLNVSPTMKRASKLAKAKKHYEIPNPPGSMRKEEVVDEGFNAPIETGLSDKTLKLYRSGIRNKAKTTTDTKKQFDLKTKAFRVSNILDTRAAKKKGVAEGAPIVVMPSHKRLEKKHKPSVSRGMDPAKAQGEQDARDGKPYNNPYPFKKELGAPGNWGHISYKASYDSVKQGVSEETLDEISLGDYKEKAKSQSKELKKHTKGEYGGIAQRMLDRRNKGLKMFSKREKASHENTVDMTEENKDKKSASEKMSDYANKRHKVYQGIQDKQKELMKKWNDDHKDEPHLQVPIPEDVGDPMAAIKGVPVPESMAQKIKSMYKKKVSEDTYDSEKDDKYAENPTFGKNPKLKQVDDKSVDGGFSKKPQAAAILTGGTTLTGQKRDTVEIDPKMKNPRPGQSDPNGDRKQ
jgi:hypothetical protein